MPSAVISVSRVIPASADKIYSLVADPCQHPVIDGSGTVQAARQQPGRLLTVGETFGMDMKMVAKYSMINTVIEAEPNKRFAWRANFGDKGLGKKLTGRIWRYELEAVDGGTKVTESWDVSKDGMGWILKRLGPLRKETTANMAKTLEKIEKILASEA